MMLITKRFLAISAFLALPVALFAYTSPGKPAGLLSDFAHVLTAEDLQNISAKLQALNRETGFEVAVVTVPTIGNDETIETYAGKLFQEWGIGGEEKDTGLLLLIAIKDREVRIETGYGTEGAVTDIQSGNIIRNVIAPAFREGKYGTGISGAVDALGSIITNSPEAAQYSVDSGSANISKNNINPFALFFVVIFMLNALARVLGKTKSWWLGGVIGGVIGSVIGLIWGFLYFGIGSIVILTILGLLFDFIVSKRPPGSDGKGGGFWPIFFGGGRGGSSGGGFGGFGGGMSGGGGASGRW